MRRDACGVCAVWGVCVVLVWDRHVCSSDWPSSECVCVVVVVVVVAAVSTDDVCAVKTV